MGLIEVSNKFKKRKMKREVILEDILIIYRIVAFDEPNIMFQDMAFEKRYRLLLERINSEHPFIISQEFVCLSFLNLRYYFDQRYIIAHRLLCKSRKQMSDYSREIMESSGEGVILRRRGSLYENGRSPALIKVKVC